MAGHGDIVETVGGVLKRCEGLLEVSCYTFFTTAWFAYLGAIAAELVEFIIQPFLRIWPAVNNSYTPFFHFTLIANTGQGVLGVFAVSLASVIDYKQKEIL